MELYSSSMNQPEIHDSQPYYRTPALCPEDIICPGSDAEETFEEIKQKRLRYERQARRYLRGHRPLLLSASLRGPFEDWRNPWLKRAKDNFRPAPSKQSAGHRELSSRNTDRAFEHNRNAEKHGPARERSKPILPGSVSKASVTKSQLGYVDPAEVLAWQARVDSESAEEGSMGLDHRNDHTRRKSMLDSAMACHISGSAESKAGPADSMINHYAQTPHNDTSNFTRIPKRAGDSEWLMGSYVSKRARWDGPALSSPTPLPNSVTSRHSAQRVTLTSPAERQQLGIRDETMNSTTTPYRQASDPQDLNGLQADTLFSAQVDNRAMLHWSLPSSNFQSTQTDSKESVDQTRKMGMGVGLDELQGQTVDMTPDQSRLPETMSSKTDITKNPISSYFKQDALTAFTPRTDMSEKHNTSGSLHANFTGCTLPKLPHTNQHSQVEIHEDSFVSDVAPSSRNLEQFHFKKRKRRTVSTENGRIGIEERLADENLSIAVDEVPDDQLLQLDSQLRDEQSPMENFDTSQPPSITEAKTVQTLQDNVEDLTQSQNLIHIGQSPTEKSSAKAANCLQASRECLPIAENADEGSFTFGEMSFLRAVLRAGNSSNNTPSHEAARLDSRETPILADANNKGDSGLHDLADFDFNPLKPDSSASPQKRHPASLSLPEPISLKNSIRRDASSPEDNVRRETSSSFKSPAGTGIPSESNSFVGKNAPTPYESSAKERVLSQSESAVIEKAPNSVLSSRLNNSSPPNMNSTFDAHLPLPMVDISQSDYFQKGEEEEAEEEAEVVEEGAEEGEDGAEEEEEEEEDELTQGSQMSNPSLPMLQPKQSQDPNDFSTQSYNTTPFKSQRSLHVRQLTRSSSTHDDVESCEDGSDIEEDVMDMIQLQLSQVCPTSPLVAFDEEEDVRHSVSSTRDITEAGTIQEPLTHVDVSPKVPSSAHRSPGIHNEIQRSEADVETEFEVEAPEGITGQSPDNVLEDSWEGCGPQSPWAVEFVEPIAATEAAVPSGNGLDRSEDKPVEQNDDSDSSDWQQLESPTIPLVISDQPLEEPATPRETPKPKELTPPEALTNTQLLVDAATKNPWATSNKKPTAMKKMKRVSFGDFGDLPSQDEESQPIQVKFGPASQLSQGDHEDEIHHDSRSNNLSSFGKISTSRRFKNILPAIMSSPAHSSPALPAQAEAFIAADQEVAIEQEPSPFLTPSRHLKPRSEMDNNLMWQQPDKPTMLLSSYMRLSSPSSPPQETSIAGFDMEEALGEAGKFLEDWSVDSELKKAKETTKTPESNGYRRRRLFGLV